MMSRKKKLLLQLSGQGGEAALDAEQILFASPYVTPNSNGVVEDTSGNSNDGQLKNAPCLVSAGSGVIALSSLSQTIVSWEGTAVSVVKSGNNINVGAGTVYNIVLSGGVLTIPLSEGAGTRIHRSDNGVMGTISGFTWGTQNTYFHAFAANVGKFIFFNNKSDRTRLTFKDGFWPAYGITGDESILRNGIPLNRLQDFIVTFDMAQVATAAAPSMVIFTNNWCNNSPHFAGFKIRINEALTAFTLTKATNNSTTAEVTSSAFSVISNGVPRKIAVVKNGTAVSFYMNGALISSHTLASATIIYTSSNPMGIDTTIGSEFMSTFYNTNGGYGNGWVYNVQIGAYSAENLASVTSQVDLAIPNCIWRCNKLITRKNTLIAPDEVSGYDLTFGSDVALLQQVKSFNSGGVYGYPKGRFWKDLGYQLDLQLAGKETALTADALRDHDDGDFKYFDNYEATNIRTYASAPSVAQVKTIDAEIGYIPSDGVILIKEAGQSNSQGFTNNTPDPDAEYLGPQVAKIFADTNLSGNPAWEPIEGKVNCEGIIDTNSVSMNVAVAYQAENQNALGSNLRFIKYAVGNTAIEQRSPDVDWNPASSGEMLDLSNAYDEAAIDAIIAEGIPASKIKLAKIDWFQGEADANAAAGTAYYLGGMLEIFESMLDTYIAKGVDTSKCVITVFVIYLPQSQADGDRNAVRFYQVMSQYYWKTTRPSLVGKCKDIVFFRTDTYQTDAAGGNVHFTNIGQVNMGIDSYNNITKSVLRTIRPIA